MIPTSNKQKQNKNKTIQTTKQFSICIPSANTTTVLRIVESKHNYKLDYVIIVLIISDFVSL